MDVPDRGGVDRHSARPAAQSRVGTGEVAARDVGRLMERVQGDARGAGDARARTERGDGAHAAGTAQLVKLRHERARQARER